jgi:uncharacterized Tic20 family protein
MVGKEYLTGMEDRCFAAEDGLAKRRTEDPMPDKQPTASPTHKTAILTIILISYVMIVLDISVVLTGLPKIHRELGFTDAGLAWVQSAYTLTFGGVMLVLTLVVAVLTIAPAASRQVTPDTVPAKCTA